MKPFLTVYGHVTIDQIVSIGKFPGINETVDVLTKKTTLGGTGSNIAMVAAKLGVPTSLSSFVGPDFPDRFRRDLEGSGLIMDEFVTVDDYETSQATVINTPELQQKCIFYQGPLGFATKIGKDLLNNASRSERVHFCTGEPDYYLHLMEELRGKTDVALDPSQETYRLWPKERLEKGLPLASALFCNEYEAKVIEERLNLKSVLDIDLPLVVRTDGERGSQAKIGGKIESIPCVKADKVVDPTGCGDSYRAGFYSGLFHGYSVKDSLILASSTSSFVIEKTGALTNIPTWEMVEERAKTYMK